MKVSFIPIFNKKAFIKVFLLTKGQILMKHFICDNPQRPNIYFMVIIVISVYLWSHVYQSSDGSISASSLSSEPKINNLYLILASNKNILWRNVTMNKPVLMDFFESFENLAQQIFYLIFRQLLPLEHSPKSGSTILHKHQNIIFILLMKVQFYYIRMLQCVENSDLILKASVLLLELSWRYHFFMNDFQSANLLTTFNYLYLAKRGFLGYLFHYHQFFQVDVAILRDPYSRNTSYTHIYYSQLYIQMKAGKNKELDYLLINLCEQPQPTNRDEALQYRERHSLRRQAWTFWGTDQYYRYGPGVILYFTLLKYLILLLGVLTITSLPALIVNFQGTGLQIYGNSASSTLMRFSLANQPSLSLQMEDKDTQKDMQILRDIKVGHTILVINDILSSIIFICFLIYWQLKSQDLVCEMIKKQALPSYHTLLVNLPTNKSISQQELRVHFQSFGGVRQVEFVFDYGAFLLQVKQFLEVVQKYNEEKNWMKKEKLYDEIEQNYLKIKKIYQSAAESNMTLHQVPFHPKMAFVSFEDPDLANRVSGIYKYKIGNLNLDFDGCPLGVKRCHVEPLSIIWQNYHMPPCSQIQRSWMFGCLVSVILVVTLVGIFLMSLHTDTKWNNQKSAINNVIDFQTVVNSTDKQLIHSFCDSLNYKNFQWKYYEVCAEYFSDFQHHWMFVLSISGIIVCINIFLIKIVFVLAQLRRFRTLPQQKWFLIISIFLTYFFSSSLLPILLRGQVQVQGHDWSIAAFAQKLFPSLPTVQVYRQANRKWYLQIGKLLLVNYILALNICPWLYIIQQWILQKIREVWSKLTSSQRKMKERLLDRQFFWQFYNAVLLNAVYTCLIFSVAMPLFYFLALLSVVSLFLTSKVIFHLFTRQPQVYDHKLNSFMTNAITFGLIVHQLASNYFFSVEQIFPENQSYLFSKTCKSYTYLGLTILVSIFLLMPKKIASIIRKRTESRKDELMITEQINSSFGAAGTQQLKDLEEKVQNRQKQKVPLVRIRKGTYLNSYKMQDNPYYNNLSYTLLILYQTIIQNKEPDLSLEKKRQLFLKNLSQCKEPSNQKCHHSLNEGIPEKFVEQEILESERVLNQSI